MKKILIIIILSLSIQNNIEAQTIIQDTTAYLRDSIYGKRNYYIGKPLAILLQNLKINIQGSYPLYNYLNSNHDTVLLRAIHFEFTSPIQALQRHPVIQSFMEVKFTTAQKIPFLHFKRNPLMYDLNFWITNKRNYYMTNRFVVSAIKLSSKGQSWGY